MEAADKALAKEQKDLEKQLAALQQKYRRTQKKIVRAFDGEYDQVARALDAEALEQRTCIEATDGRLLEISETRDNFKEADRQVDESLGVISLIEKLWDEKDYIGLRRAIGILVKEVDIREDGAWMVLKPLRVLDNVVITTGEKAARTGVEPVAPP